MTKFIPLVTILGLAALGANAVGQGQPVKALPPHPLDGAFGGPATAKGFNEALLNNDLYKKAIQAAIKAKLDMERQYRERPNLASSTPEQAARTEFLRVLADEASGAGVAK